jgi:hypothetical protein
MVAVSLLSSPDDVGLSAFKLFSIDVDPVTDPTRYQTMAGYNYRTGYYEPFDTTGDQAPGDKRFLEASGPVDVPAHGTATFWYAIIGSPFGDPGEVGPKHDTSELAIRYRTATERLQQILAVAEEKPTPVIEHLALQTLVRGVLELPPGKPGQSTTGQSLVFLLDAAGRRVAELHAGSNDVSGLAPGVYFVRGQGSGGRGLGSVRKVILAE